ncbi:lipase family protein [Dietzia sp. DQ12-76]|uniref:lipase family protein n=1 Tax=Dietzia sp. DQ12-76 TaxID=1630639 RepID=UPI0015F90C4E|nr:lipase family protein [Dietzia sp. DQ12-76]MBB1025112.1 alpha/beta fold hydrolase [Dietzia sp. DQ12-76]
MRSPSADRTTTPRGSTLAGALALGLVVALAPVLTTGPAPVASAQPVAGAQGSSNAPDRTAFYTPPADLPAVPGTVIRSEPMVITPSFPDIVAGGTLTADAQRIMYRSTGAAGGPVAVTGTYLQPRAPWNGSGPRPLAVVTPGTQGQGDQCAPSKSMEVGLGIGTAPVSLAAGYSLIDAYSLLAEGFAVVVTDYEGLGTPGHHPYVNRVSQGRSALDAARAAVRLAGTDLALESPTVVSGYSQGGGAAAAAAEMHREYAPELNLVGVAAGAPPSDMLGTLERVDGGVLTGAVGYAINGILQVHPELRPAFDRQLNDEGRRMLEVTSTQCVGETAFAYGLRRTTEFTVHGNSLAEAARSEPEILRVLESYNLGRVAPTVPALVLIGRNDDVVPHDTAVDLVRNWCAQGTVVELRIAELPALAPGLVIDHALPMLSERETNARYLMERVHGVPASNSCGTV